MGILRRKKLPIKINMSELINLKNGHLLNTRVIIAKMYAALPKELKQEVNMADLQEAAMYHDYGKVLIPSKILNKNDELTPEETKIMHLHSEIGYELLKEQGIRDSVLRLIKYHHQTPDKIGYPEANEDFEFDISLQMLKAADEYSALTEKRPYRDALSKSEALEILYKDVENGILSKEVFLALKKAV